MYHKSHKTVNKYHKRYCFPGKTTYFVYHKVLYIIYCPSLLTISNVWMYELTHTKGIYIQF